MNWLAWDGETHIPIDPKLFAHLSQKNILEWKNRINKKVRYREIMKMFGVSVPYNGYWLDPKTGFCDIWRMIK